MIKNALDAHTMIPEETGRAPSFISNKLEREEQKTISFLVRNIIFLIKL